MISKTQGESKENQGDGDPTAPLLSRHRLQQLVKEVNPAVELDAEQEDMLLKMVDEFIETTLDTSCLLAKHRNSRRVEMKDLQLCLEQYWNIRIPGFGNDEIRPHKRAAAAEAHKQRKALIRKTNKKH